MKDIATSKTFCILPWTHLSISTRGEARPCCHANQSYPVGHMNKSTLREIWNGENMRNLRMNMLKGIGSEECRRCYEYEKSNIKSYRQQNNEVLAHHFDKIAKTKEDGTVEDFHLPYIDIRFSNQCNLKCRTCGPERSSAWYKDAKALKLGREYKVVIRPESSGTDIWDQIKDLIPRIEKIYFAGGEPILMEEHYKFLDLLTERKLFDVQLVYDTNFSKLKFGRYDVVKYWQNFKSVTVNASLDGTGPKGEYIRSGLNWDQVIANRKILNDFCPHVRFRISPTLSVLNVFHLPDLHRECVENGMIGLNDFNINIVTNPKIYNVQILPQKLKEAVRDKYENHIHSFITPRISSQDIRALKGFRGIQKYLFMRDMTLHIPAFLKRTRELDQIRKESFENLFPELHGLNQFVVGKTAKELLIGF